MKFIISSKHLANTLSSIDFLNDNIENIIFCEYQSVNILTVQTRKTSIEINLNMVVQRPFIKKIRQNSRRWDWLNKLVTSVEDQPILITVTEDKLDITFQY